jgi:dTDP-4-dehydrorhamnose 3,5-epimerase-like enzyme
MSTVKVQALRPIASTLQPFRCPDDRGYFLEVQRIGRGLNVAFQPETMQISAAINYPGTIKAFHYHLHQTDCWTPVKGMPQVALADLRLESPTFVPHRSLLQSQGRRVHSV